MSRLLSPVGVAQEMGIAVDTARDWMATGRIPGAFRLGHSHVITQADFTRWRGGGEANGRARNPNDAWLSSYAVREWLAKRAIRVVHVTVLKWFREKVIPAQKVGRAWAVRREDLEAWYDDGAPRPRRGRPRKRPRRAEGPPTLGTTEVARRLGVFKGEAREMCQRGKFPGATRNGERGHWQVPVADVEAFLRERRTDGVRETQAAE